MEEKEYYVDSETINKNYGITDYLNTGYDIKTLGGINGDKYLFKVGIADHYVSHQDIDKIIGEKNSYISTYREDDKVDLYLQALKYDDLVLTQFELDSMIGVLNECVEYKKNNDINIRVMASGVFFSDNKDRETTDLDNLINDLTEMKENIRNKSM